MADQFKALFDRAGLQYGAFEAKFAKIDAVNKCKAEATGRAYPLQRQPTEEETQAIEWIQKVQQLDHPNRNWTRNEFMDILNRTEQAFRIVTVEANDEKYSFMRDVAYGYARNCLNSDESGPQLHREMYQSHLQTIHTDLTYHISNLHVLAGKVVRLSPQVVDRFRTDLHTLISELTAPQSSIDFHGYQDLVRSLLRYWVRVLPSNITWHHVMMVLMIAGDTVCKLFKTCPQHVARDKAQRVLDGSAVPVENFLTEPNNWAMLKTMNLEEIPENFVAPDDELFEIDEDTRQEILNDLEPCHLIKGICPRPCPKLIDLAFSAFPGETVSDKQALYESNKPELCTTPIFI